MEPRRLTRGAIVLAVTGRAWGPSGRVMAVALVVARQLYVMNADGSNVQRLASSVPWAMFPAWSGCTAP